AYGRIAEALSAWFPEMKVLPRSAFREVATITEGGDLAGMLGLQDRFREERVDLEPLIPLHARRNNAGFLSLPPGVPAFKTSFAMERDDPTLPRAVIFRDSYTGHLVPMLSEHFRRVVYVWDYSFDRAMVERERPDVVIQELVERILKDPPPVDR